MLVESGQLGAWLGQRAHVFLLPRSGLVFGSLVPKGFSINVSVLGSGKYPVSVNDFLRHDLVRQTLPGNYQRGCGCRPQAVIRPARNYFADGFVAIGDAAVSRLYKDGIGSAFLRPSKRHGSRRRRAYPGRISKATICPSADAWPATTAGESSSLRSTTGARIQKPSSWPSSG